MKPDDPPPHLDTTGLICPLPVLKIRKRLADMAPGAVLAVTATDPAAQIDVAYFCAEAGHELVESSIEGENYCFTIRRGPD